MGRRGRGAGGHPGDPLRPAQGRVGPGEASRGREVPGQDREGARGAERSRGRYGHPLQPRRGDAARGGGGPRQELLLAQQRGQRAGRTERLERGLHHRGVRQRTRQEGHGGGERRGYLLHGGRGGHEPRQAGGARPLQGRTDRLRRRQGPGGRPGGRGRHVQGAAPQREEGGLQHQDGAHARGRGPGPLRRQGPNHRERHDLRPLHPARHDLRRQDLLRARLLLWRADPQGLGRRAGREERQLHHLRAGRAALPLRQQQDEGHPARQDHRASGGLLYEAHSRVRAPVLRLPDPSGTALGLPAAASGVRLLDPRREVHPEPGLLLGGERLPGRHPLGRLLPGRPVGRALADPLPEALQVVGRDQLIVQPRARGKRQRAVGSHRTPLSDSGSQLHADRPGEPDQLQLLPPRSVHRPLGSGARAASTQLQPGIDQVLERRVAEHGTLAQPVPGSRPWRPAAPAAAAVGDLQPLLPDAGASRARKRTRALAVPFLHHLWPPVPDPERAGRFLSGAPRDDRGAGFPWRSGGHHALQIGCEQHQDGGPAPAHPGRRAHPARIPAREPGYELLRGLLQQGRGGEPEPAGGRVARQREREHGDLRHVPLGHRSAPVPAPRDHSFGGDQLPARVPQAELRRPRDRLDVRALHGRAGDRAHRRGVALRDVLGLERHPRQVGKRGSAQDPEQPDPSPDDRELQPARHSHGPEAPLRSLHHLEPSALEQGGDRHELHP